MCYTVLASCVLLWVAGDSSPERSFVTLNQEYLNKAVAFLNPQDGDTVTSNALWPPIHTAADSILQVCRHAQTLASSSL